MPCLLDFYPFFMLKNTGTGDKAQAKWDFKGKAGPPALGHVNDKLGMLPVFVLECRHIERAAFNLAQQHVVVAQPEFRLGKAHGCRAVATAATLVEQQFAVRFFELPDDSRRSLGDQNPGCWHESM